MSFVKISEKIILNKLKNIESGNLKLVNYDGKVFQFGNLESKLSADIKITNPKNGKYLISEVKSNKIKFSNFYNSVLSLRIAEELELDFNEPFVELTLVSKNSTFVAKKAKMFEEEKKVARKAPVDGITINDLNFNETKKKQSVNKNFSYLIKVADFYYKDTAKMMTNRIKNEAKISNVSIITLSKTKNRVLIGPFNDIKSLKVAFEKMSSFNFENLEILKNVKKT